MRGIDFDMSQQFRIIAQVQRETMVGPNGVAFQTAET